MIVQAIVEIPRGSRLKYEVDKATGLLVVDRLINQPVPYNYGYVPGTLCGDGDPLDVFIVSEESIVPLTKVKVKVIGVLVCIDNDQQDDKLIGVIEGDESGITGSRIISNYLSSYKSGFSVLEVGDANRANNIFLASVDYYEKERLSDEHNS